MEAFIKYLLYFVLAVLLSSKGSEFSFIEAITFLLIADVYWCVNLSNKDRK